MTVCKFTLLLLLPSEWLFIFVLVNIYVYKNIMYDALLERNFWIDKDRHYERCYTLFMLFEAVDQKLLIVAAICYNRSILCVISFKKMYTFMALSSVLYEICKEICTSNYNNIMFTRTGDRAVGFKESLWRVYGCLKIYLQL